MASTPSNSSPDKSDILAIFTMLRDEGHLGDTSPEDLTDIFCEELVERFAHKVKS